VKSTAIIITLLFAIAALTLTASIIQVPLPLKVDGHSSVNVSTAKVIWEKTYGATDFDDRALFMVPTDDDFLVVGSTKSVTPNTMTGWVIKLNADGNIVWNKTYLFGKETEIRYAVNLQDGYLLVGNQFTEGADENGYVVLTDRDGNQLWDTTLGGSKIDKLFTGVAMPDGFIVAGLSFSASNQSEAWAVKLGYDGNVVWNKTYSNYPDSAIRSGVYAENGDCVFTGYCDIQDDGNYDFALYELSADGNVVWNQTYGGEDSEKAYSMTKANDGYVLVGERQSTDSNTDAWMLKVDTAGIRVWDRRIGGSQADSPAYVAQTDDDGYLMAGFTFSVGQGQRDFWLTKLDGQGTVKFSCTQGNAAFQEAYGAIKTSDGNYVMAGWTDPPNCDELVGEATYDFYIVKLSVLHTSNWLSYLQIITAVVAFVLLLVTMLLLFKLRSNKRI
jgi:hypothetical protein